MQSAMEMTCANAVGPRLSGGSRGDVVKKRSGCAHGTFQTHACTPCSSDVPSLWIANATVFRSDRLVFDELDEKSRGIFWVSDGGLTLCCSNSIFCAACMY